MGEAARAPRGDAAGGDVGAVEEHRAARRPADAGDQLGQLRLPVAVDADQGQDLPGPHREAHPAQALGARRVAAREIGDDQALGTGRTRAALEGGGDVAPHHHPGQLVAADAGHLRAARDLAVPQHDDLVADVQDLAELVRDEDHRPAFVAEPAEHAQASGDLAWTQA